MLRKGFLGLVSDWVAHSLDAHQRDLGIALKEFGMESFLRRAENTENIAMLFSEWTVFDHKSRSFDGMTSLAYFCSNNPLHLPESEMSAYRELLDFQVGYFEVVSVKPAQSVVLRDMEGAEYDVADISSSMNLIAGETIWTRIAQIAGVYQMVGSQVLRAPFTYSQNMKKTVLAWGKNAVDAKHAAAMKYGGDGAGTKKTDDDKYLPEKEAAQAFDEALAAAGMNSMVSSATIKKWTNNERKFPLGFPMKSVFFLLPEDLTDKQRDRIVSTLQTYLANLSRKVLKGKTPLQASAEQKPDERHFDVDMYSYEDYADDVHSANGLMPKDPEKAYATYEQLIRRLLDEKVPIITAFRIFCNAGLCLLMQSADGIDPLGFELIRASLRLNPLYDFGLRQKERCIDPLHDLSGVSKKDRSLCKNLILLAEDEGRRHYRRTVFRKYEKFLEEAGISLTYKTATVATVFRTGEDGATVKIGRNDPCYCGSGKKFKKCCGS